MSTRQIVSFIPARGGSKGISRKNLYPLAGSPLITHTIMTSIASSVHETWVSTEDQEIKEVSIKYGAKVLERPDSLATDNASSESALLHFAEHVHFDVVVFLQATSPLTIPHDINNALNLLEFNDSVISVCKDHGGWLCGGFNWFEGGIPEYDLNNRPLRQDMQKRYRENGAIYISTKNGLTESRCRLNGKIGMYIMPRQRSFEIDELEDIVEIEKFLDNNKL